MKMFESKKSLGIELTAGQVRLALLKKDKKGISLLKSAVADLPEGVVENGSIEQGAVLAKLIKDVKRKNGIHCSHAVMSMFSRPMMQQIIDIPKEGMNNPRDYIEQEIKHCASMAGKETLFDFCGIRTVSQDEERRVFVAAACDNNMTSALKLFNREGMNVEAVEPGWLGYLRAVSAKRVAGKFGTSQFFVLFRDNTVTMALFRNQTLDFLRYKEVGEDVDYEHITSELDSVLEYYQYELSAEFGNWDIVVVSDDVNESLQSTFDKFGGGLDKSISVSVGNFQKEISYSSFVDSETDKRQADIAAVGLAMKLLGDENDQHGLDVNLIPLEAKRVSSVRKHAIHAVGAAAAIFFVLMVVSGIFSLKANLRYQNLNISEQRDMTEKIRGLADIKIDLAHQIAATESELSSMEKILGNYSYVKWADVLHAITAKIPKTVQITSLSGRGKDILQLYGKTVVYGDVVKFADQLSESEYVQSAKLESIKGTEKDDGYIEYIVKCVLAN